jgi:hypothetical protein
MSQASSGISGGNLDMSGEDVIQYPQTSTPTAPGSSFAGTSMLPWMIAVAAGLVVVFLLKRK